MEEPLFTSNSDAVPKVEQEARRSVIRTVVTVLAVLVACELALRVTGWPKAIPYELGGEEYNAVAAALNREDIPEVLVVGSSRAREGLNLPLLQTLLSERAGRAVSVGSYAVSGGLVSDTDAIVSRALQARTPPRLILYGIAERDISRTSPIYDQATRFWNWRDWLQATKIVGLGKALPELATVLRNHTGRYIRLIGQREQMRLTIRQRMAGTFVDARNTNVYGQLTDWQKNSPRRNLVNRPARAAEIQQNVRNFQRREYPDASLLECFRQLVERFDGTKTDIILFEVLPSRAVRKSLPKEIYPAFLDAVDRTIGTRPNVKFLTARELNLYPNDRDFREMAHLNLTGATKYTNALADLLYPPPATQPATIPQTQTSSRSAKSK